MSAQFMRKYRVIVLDSSGNKSKDVSTLRCSFTINKALNETPNYSQIKIYNLSSDTENYIKNQGKSVIVEAGYENGEFGMIFSGKIVQTAMAKEDNVTRALILVCQDGDAYLNSSFVCQSVASGTTQSDILKACTASQDIQQGKITDKLAETALARGKVLFGKPSDYLVQIAKTADAQLYVEDGMYNIVAAADYDSATAVELNPETGLVSAPEQSDDGVTAKCLINPRIKLNTRIYINSSLIQAKTVSKEDETAVAISSDGIYRVIKIETSGDTRGDDWYMTVDAVLQSGEKPDGLTSDSTRLWR